MSEDKCNCVDEQGHHHDEHCDCDHEHDHDTMEIVLDDDTTLTCDVLGVFELKEKEYIALLPQGEDTVLIYQYTEDGEEVVLDTIEEDQEFEMVSEAFYTLFGDEEDDEESEDE